VSRLLVIAALPVSLAGPAGVVAVAVSSGSSSDQHVIQLPTAPSPPTGQAAAPTASRTRSVNLFNGKTIQVDRSCADSRDLDAHKRGAVRAADRVPPLKQTLLDTRRDYDGFLAKHPEQTLAPDDYAAWKSLRRTYKTALAAYNREVDSFNRLADQYNSDLQACKVR
jgi:hypothetical protein